MSDNINNSTTTYLDPAGGNYNYVCADGKSATKIYNEKLAGGEAPELLVAKNGGSFSARISLGGKTGEMMLAFKCNKNISVEISDGAELGEPTNTGNDYLYPVTVYAGTAQS